MKREINLIEHLTLGSVNKPHRYMSVYAWTRVEKSGKRETHKT